jgi:ketosteroid isomerase-like protein
MGEADVVLVRQMMAEWQEIIAAVDDAALQPYFDKYYAHDVSVDFGSRTPDAVPGRGHGIMLEWTVNTFAFMRESGSELQYEFDDFIDCNGAVVVPGRTRARITGLDLETRFAYLLRLSDGKVYELTLYPSREEAVAAAGGA